MAGQTAAARAVAGCHKRGDGGGDWRPRSEGGGGRRPRERMFGAMLGADCCCPTPLPWTCAWACSQGCGSVRAWAWAQRSGGSARLDRQWRRRRGGSWWSGSGRRQGIKDRRPTEEQGQVKVHLRLMPGGKIRKPRAITPRMLATISRSVCPFSRRSKDQGRFPRCWVQEDTAGSRRGRMRSGRRPGGAPGVGRQKDTRVRRSPQGGALTASAWSLDSP
jgi:hypothetical protein